MLFLVLIADVKVLAFGVWRLAFGVWRLALFEDLCDECQLILHALIFFIGFFVRQIKSIQLGTR